MKQRLTACVAGTAPPRRPKRSAMQKAPGYYGKLAQLTQNADGDRPEVRDASSSSPAGSGRMLKRTRPAAAGSPRPCLVSCLAHL